MRVAHRFSNEVNGKPGPYHGLTTIRRGKIDWQGSARFIPGELDAPLRWRKPQRIFVNSMSDLFHHSLTNEEIAAVFGVMAACPQHTFQVLTKRPERAREWFQWLSERAQESGDRSDLALRCSREAYTVVMERYPLHKVKGTLLRYPWPLPNVWLGVSVEDQKTADDRISVLLELPAAVRFISYEPALGDVSLFAFLKGRVRDNCLDILKSPPMPGLDWVIVGGESGHGARPFDVAWARSVVEQCRAAGVACFVKQLGADPFCDHQKHGVTLKEPLPLRDRKGGDWSEWPENLRVRQFPEVRHG
jgi:protein gp37